MMTQDQIKQWRAQAGITPISKPISTATQSAGDRISALKAGTYGQTTSQKPSLLKEVGSATYDTAKNIISNAVSGVKQIGTGIGQLGEGIYKGTIQGKPEGADTSIRGALNVTGGVFNTGFSPGSGVVQTLNERTGTPTSDTFGTAVEKGLGADVQHGGNKNGIIEALSNNPVLQKFAVEHPNAEEVFSNILSTVLGATALEKGSEIAPKSKTDLYTSTLENLKSSGGDINRAIEAGDVPLDQIYKPDGAFTRPRAEQAVGDIIGKMNQYEKGLGNKFAMENLNLEDIRPADLTQKATSFFESNAGKPNALAETVASGASAVSEKAGELATKVKEKITGTPEGNALSQKAKDLESLRQKISPKPTIKEAKLATEQGRLVKGKEPGLVTRGTPDQVLVSPQQFKSIQTIDRLIPDHANLSEPDLVMSLKEKIGETADQLKPEMKAVKIKPETVQKITDEWTAIKKAQRNNAYTPSDVNVKKLQADFETRLKKSKGGSMNDLWETRQAYDDSVPDNVKRANEISSESLQAKKEIWLENRRILTDAINDPDNGLGETSRKAFSDMTDMYEAKNGIISKAKIETKPKPSKARQIINRHPIIKAGVKAAGFGTGIHLLP